MMIHWSPIDDDDDKIRKVMDGDNYLRRYVDDPPVGFVTKPAAHHLGARCF